MKLRKLAYFIASGGGTGYAPVIPGTVGSLAALLIYALFPANDLVWLIVIIMVYFSGVWTSGLVEKDEGKDRYRRRP